MRNDFFLSLKFTKSCSSFFFPESVDGDEGAACTGTWRKGCSPASAGEGDCGERKTGSESRRQKKTRRPPVDARTSGRKFVPDCLVDYLLHDFVLGENFYRDESVLVPWLWINASFRPCPHIPMCYSWSLIVFDSKSRIVCVDVTYSACSLLFCPPRSSSERCVADELPLVSRVNVKRVIGFFLIFK